MSTVRNAFLILVVAVFVTDGAYPQWAEQNVTNNGNSAAASISLDAAGDAHVAYSVQTTKGKGKKKTSREEVFYVNNMGGNFGPPEQVTTGEFSSVRHTDIAVDLSDDVHITFVADDVVYYTNNTAGTWSTPLAVSQSGFRTWAASIAVSSTGPAHIVYPGDPNDGSGISDIFYTENSSGSFSVPLNLTGDAQFNGSGEAAAIDVDALDQVHIAFEIGTCGASCYDPADIYYTNNIGGSFAANVTVVAEVDGIHEEKPSLAIDNAGNAHIGYREELSGCCDREYIYKTNSGGTFDAGTVVSAAVAPGYYVSNHLTPDSSGKMHVVLRTPQNDGNRLQYATNVSGSFVTEFVTSNTRSRPMIEVDGDGNGHIIAENGGDIYYYTNEGSSPPPSSATCFVHSIDMSLAYKGNGKPSNRGWTATATVTIHDTDNNSVAGATVAGHWSGLTSDTDNGITNSNGQVSLSSNRINTEGTFTFTIDNVTGCDYDPGLNVMTSNSISTSSKRAPDETIAQTSLPSEFQLFQNHPNPFNPETVIRFALSEASHVEITIYNTRGQVIRRLLSQNSAAGEHAVKWDGRDQSGRSVSSGVYLYEIQAGDPSAGSGQRFRQVKKMSLLR
jgi:hypothetical protein